MCEHSHTFLADRSLKFFESITEPGEHFSHVASLLHRDDTSMILLVNLRDSITVELIKFMRIHSNSTHTFTILSSTLTHTCTCTLTHTHAHARSHTRAHAHSHTHVHKHTHTHVHMHTHTHVHTHTHTLSFAHPDQKVLRFIMPNASSIRPVTSHVRSQEKRRDRLVEEEMVINELLLFSICHLSKWIVLACMCVCV